MNKNQNKLLYLLNFSEKYKIFTFIGLILEIFSTACILTPYIYIWKFIQEIIKVYPDISNAYNLETYAINAVIFAIAGVLLNFLALMCTHYSAFKNEENMKKKTIKHLTKLPLGYYSNHTSGELRKIIDLNTSQTESFLAHMLPNLVGAVCAPVIFIILLLNFNWILGILCILPIVFAFLMLIPMFSKNNINFMKEYQKYMEDMNSEATEYFRGIPVTKTFQQSVYSFKKFHKAIVNYGHCAKSYSLSTQLPMTLFTLSVNGFYIILIPAGILLAGSTVNSKFLTDFIFYIIFTPVCAGIINKIMMVAESWETASQSIDKIENILNIKPLEEAVDPQEPEDYSIEFENVNFDYNKKNRGKHILNNINLSIKEHEKIALVGPSGSGKTTIAKLIPRFYDTDTGSIKIGNVNIKNMSHDRLMKSISFVFQDSYLFKDTIYNNVRMGTEHSKKEIMEALSLARCEDIIEKLPDGINTVIGSKGTYLSGGEQQRIILARAILKDAPIIILDEATAMADPENELKIQKGINEVTKNKTVIMIAHRLSTVKNLDKIYVVDDGEITEEGNHESLIKLNGTYRDMWDNYNKSLNWKINSNTADNYITNNNEVD